MKGKKISMLLVVAVVALVAIPWGMNQARAADGGYSVYQSYGHTWYANSSQPDSLNPDLRPVGTNTNPSGQPIRKFITKLPGLGPTNVNEIGQYIPIAQRVGNRLYPNDDYYILGEVEFTELMHPDLPKATRLRGYRDLSVSTNAPHYLGPLIIAKRNRPVRLLVKNQLPWTNGGRLFIPTDTTLMGGGKGPDMTHDYTDNRTALHLHGGFTPWISDGTPYQWFTPAVPRGQTALTYAKGASFQNVPDMIGSGKPIPLPNTNDGLATFYYTNQQSGRLMFYHDHAVAITRLHVYTGMAAGYLITDPVEDDMINGTNNTGGNPGSQKVLPGQGAGVYTYGIPLIIQDKTFIPNNIDQQDSKWNIWRASAGIASGVAVPGDLWFPHVLEPNQDPNSDSGASLFGRWDYGPWFWPAQPIAALTANPPVAGASPLPGEDAQLTNPWAYNSSIVPEGFMDTPIINGNAYPYLELQPATYRFRILNACNDRNINLSLFVADTGGGSGATATATVLNGAVNTLTLGGTPVGGANYTSAPNVYIYGGGGTGATATATLAPQAVAAFKLISGGSGYTNGAKVVITGGGGSGATATATVVNGVVTAINLTSGGTSTYTTAPRVSILPAATNGPGSGALAVAELAPGSIAAITLTNGGDSYATAPTVLVGSATEVRMVDAVPYANLPVGWPTDGRDGGIPDPNTAGPSLIQIGTEGGILPAPVVIPSQPVNYNYNRRDIVVLNVQEKSLFMGPAERADVVVDFSQFAGKTIILYNDAPAPVPAFDPRYDYYTGNPSFLDSGGADSTIPGYGPNTRTMMQIRVAPGTGTPFNLANLQAALPAAFNVSQPKPMIPQAAYGPAYNTTFTDTYARIQNTQLTFTDYWNNFPQFTGGAGTKTVPMQPKSIQELFDDLGRMNATLAMELPNTNFTNQTTIPLKYIDPPTETVHHQEGQIWKITHNGVDTHSIHFHLVNVQVINRVGWDGAIRPPDANELGWKETVRMNPLEDCIVAMKWTLPPALPFAVPHSVRPLDPGMNLGLPPAGDPFHFTNIDPTTGNPIVTTNVDYDYGWEYVWHCHLLGHEENDMMRPIAVNPTPLPDAP